MFGKKTKLKKTSALICTAKTLGGWDRVGVQGRDGLGVGVWGAGWVGDETMKFECHLGIHSIREVLFSF